MTFCPWPGFKKPGFYFSVKLLDENTYALADIFENDTLDELRDETMFEIREIKNYIIGRCFMIR